MSSLSLYLPPFTSDYAGAASALFDLDCLVAINDGSCCTAHFANYEEPRWAQGKKQTLCTNLRMNDAVFGIDDRIVRQLGEAAQELKAKRVVSLGTPVPGIIGTDMPGLAAELESVCEIPSYGIDTNGFSHYVYGIDKVFDLVLQISKSLPKPVKKRKYINILGMTPIDFHLESAASLAALLEQEDIEIGTQLFMGTSEESLAYLPYASCNLAISYAGILAAQKLEKECKIPYLACSFTSYEESQEALATLRAYMQGQQIPTHNKPDSYVGEKSILIVGDQVIANSMRHALKDRGIHEHAKITIASFFGIDDRHAEEGDLCFADEKAFLRHLKAHSYDLVVGDPVLKHIPLIDKEAFVELVHPAISSRLYRGKEPCCGRFDLDELALKVETLLL